MCLVVFLLLVFFLMLKSACKMKVADFLHMCGRNIWLMFPCFDICSKHTHIECEKILEKICKDMKTHVRMLINITQGSKNTTTVVFGVREIICCTLCFFVASQAVIQKANRSSCWRKQKELLALSFHHWEETTHYVWGQLKLIKFNTVISSLNPSECFHLEKVCWHSQFRFWWLLLDKLLKSAIFVKNLEKFLASL